MKNTKGREKKIIWNIPERNFYKIGNSHVVNPETQDKKDSLKTEEHLTGDYWY